ncbi:MAG: hypothetical protein ACUVSX_00505 [Aggregatilineales bacterium]
MWTGRYDHYQGEWVSSQDAARIAEALTNALDDLPNHPMPDRVFGTEIEELDYEDHVAITFHIVDASRRASGFHTLQLYSLSARSSV